MEDGLLFPKGEKRRKRKEKTPSIMHDRSGTCYLCMLLLGDKTIHPYLHKHHVFGGRNRQMSEQYGLTVWLCVEHHETGKFAVHRNPSVMYMLHQLGQQAFEAHHTRAEWMAAFGKNYLGGWDD